MPGLLGSHVRSGNEVYLSPGDCNRLWHPWQPACCVPPGQLIEKHIEGRRLHRERPASFASLQASSSLKECFTQAFDGCVAQHFPVGNHGRKHSVDGLPLMRRACKTFSRIAVCTSRWQTTHEATEGGCRFIGLRFTGHEILHQLRGTLRSGGIHKGQFFHQAKG